MTWQDDAACRGHQHVMLLPDRPRRASHRGPIAKRIAQAKVLCRSCPVLAECREWALQYPDPAVGLVAGGLTDIERHTRRFGVRAAG